MPDPQPPKREPLSPSRKSQRANGRGVRYAELHCCTNFSFLEGASHPDELVQRAIELDYAALAITDRASLAGVVRAYEAARDKDTKETKLKLIIGAAIAPVDSAPLLLWATNREAYGRLASLLTLARRSAPKGEYLLSFADVAAYADGLLAGVLLRGIRGVNEYKGEPLLVQSTFDFEGESRHTIAPTSHLRLASGPRNSSLLEQLRQYREVFGDRCYAVAELHRGQQDQRRLLQMVQLGREARVPLVAANDVHYHIPQRRPLHDVLTATRLGCTVAELGDRLFVNAERYLKPLEEMWRLFEGHGAIVERTMEVADRCTFSLDELRYDYPEELCPPGMTPLEHLTQLTWEGAKFRYSDGVPDKVRALIEHELVLIAELRYEAYFLTVWDLVKFARSQEILCQGRGSAANSVVCYCLEITSVDPERIDVLFERFVSKERNEAPDIDVDFEHERREEVVQYIYNKYGRDRAGMTAEVITYRARSAIRDVSKALGLSQDRIDVLAKAVGHHRHGDEDNLAARLLEVGIDPRSRFARQLAWLVEQLLGFPRHLSQHVGGMVISHRPLRELVPIENASMPDRTVIQWDKNDLDTLGILKVDCLALGMLTAIRKCFDLVATHHDRRYTLTTVPSEDKAVYEMIDQADTIGVFQIESRAQMSMLPRLRPEKFYDLVIEVAIVRPGPIQGKMVHPYLRRRRGEEPVDYPSEGVRRVLEKTLGVSIFQEQVMQLVMVAAGFTPGEADKLRRAMGAWRRRGVMEPFRQKLIDGMLGNGYTLEFAERIYQQIQGFGEYGFPESHAASFALLAYDSAWLKCYYPAAFAAALLNSQPMGFYAPAQLVSDARNHGVEIRPIDVNFSDWDCTLESSPNRRSPALRLGFRMIRGMATRYIEAIVAERKNGVFQSFTDFTKRTGLRRAALKRLGQADVFGSLTLNRRDALWQSLPEREALTAFDEVDHDKAPAALPPMSPFAEVVADYGTAGLTLRQHPVSFIRPKLNELGILPASRLLSEQNGRWVKVAGLVLLRQRPGTAKGITFMTLEDETGTANLIVRKEIWEAHRRVARSAVALIAHGKLQRENEVTHVLVNKLEDLSHHFTDLVTHSHDFH
jgi:error-prone DNA polymerase